jgi:predicted HicB family RNase H-like nuclease
MPMPRPQLDAPSHARIEVRLPLALKARLVAEADRRGMSLSAAIKQAVENFLAVPVDK